MTQEVWHCVKNDTNPFNEKSIRLSPASTRRLSVKESDEAAYLLKKAMKLQVLDPLPRQDVPHLY